MGDLPAPLLSLIVPVYREGEAVVPSLRAMEASLDFPHETLVVYDFDEDPTRPPVERLAREIPSIRPVRNRLGRGVVNAVRAGFAEARADWRIVTMADGSDDPRDYARIVDAFRAGADVVSPSRYRPGGRLRGGPFWKGLFSRLAGLSLHLGGILPVSDPTNAFKGYHRRVTDRFDIESRGGFEYNLELVFKAHRAGMRFAEFPTLWRDRTEGESRFQMGKWIPLYLAWVARAVAARFAWIVDPAGRPRPHPCRRRNVSG